MERVPNLVNVTHLRIEVAKKFWRMHYTGTFEHSLGAVSNTDRHADAFGANQLRRLTIFWSLPVRTVVPVYASISC